jgi:hypothetical protein
MCAHRHHRMSPGTRSAPGAAPTAQRVLPRRAHHRAEAAFYGPGILVGAELLCALPARSSGNRADDLPAGASVSVGSWPGFAPARPGPIAGVSCPESACCWPRLGCCTSTRPSGRAAGRLEYAHVAATEFLTGCRPVAAAGRHRRRACRPRSHRPGRPGRSAAPLPRRGRRRDHRQPQPCGPRPATPTPSPGASATTTFTTRPNETCARSRSSNVPPADAGAPRPGLVDFAVVQSRLSTASKCGLESIDVLTRLFTTGAWLPPQLPLLISYRSRPYLARCERQRVGKDARCCHVRWRRITWLGWSAVTHVGDIPLHRDACRSLTVAAPVQDDLSWIAPPLRVMPFAIRWRDGGGCRAGCLVPTHQSAS